MSRPYSDRALEAAQNTFDRPRCAVPGARHMQLSLDAAHDREALGLEASVCAREFLNEIADVLERACIRFDRAGAWSESESWRRVQNYLMLELEGRCERVLVGQGTDVADPLCQLIRGHKGRCRP